MHPSGTGTPSVRGQSENRITPGLAKDGTSYYKLASNWLRGNFNRFRFFSLSKRTDERIV